MPDTRGNAAIYLLPGMQAKLTAPGYFVAFGTRKELQSDGTYATVKLKNGFSVENGDIGTLEAVENEPAVIYTHKKFSQNKIVFYARTGETGEVDIISVPIHDHSSVVQGGPAYGTYFTDDETLGSE